MTSCRDSLSRAGKPLGSPHRSCHSTCQQSMQHLTHFAAPLILLYSSHFFSPKRLHLSTQSTSLFHFSNFSLPERLFFSTPATSFLHCSQCSAIVTQLWDFYFKVFPSRSFALRSFCFRCYCGLSDALTLLPLFFYATIS